MTEEEISLFSEFLEERQYARMDYNGLTRSARMGLRFARNKQAKNLKSARKTINNSTSADKQALRENALKVSKNKSEGLTSKARTISNLHRDFDKKNKDLKPIERFLGKRSIDYTWWRRSGSDFLN